MARQPRSQNGGASRISVSLPETLHVPLDGMVARRGYASRLQALSGILHLIAQPDQEVIFMQGPAGKLQKISDEMVARRGVIAGRINLMAALIPQVHPFIPEKARAKHKEVS